MPSWEIHEKYAKLMGIPIEIAKEIDKLIDSSGIHDFYDIFLERSSKPRDPMTIHYINYLKSLGIRRLFGINKIRVRSYNFKSSLFITSPFYEKLKTYGEDGLKAFFLHMFLDLIERNERGKNVEILEIIDGDYHFARYFWEIESFINSNFYSILGDIWKDIKRRRDRKIIKEFDRIAERISNRLKHQLERYFSDTTFKN